MKIKQVFNLDAVKVFTDSKFKDSSATGAILGRQLEHIDPKIFEKKYPALAFMNSGIAIDNSGGYSTTVVSLRINDEGGFANAGDLSDDKGKISINGEDSTIKVKDREAHSSWTDTQVERSKLQNINLPSRYLSATNSIYQRELDRIGYLGIEGITGSIGLFNYAGFATGAAAGAIDTLTAQEQYDVISNLIVRQQSAVQNTPEYMANRVDMPVRVMNVIKATILDTAAGTKSVLLALKDNHPEIVFSATSRAESTANGGDLAASVTIAYSNNDEGMKFRLPLPLQFSPITEDGFKFKMDSKYSVAGLDVLVDLVAETITGL